jgi:hypothetical protein
MAKEVTVHMAPAASSRDRPAEVAWSSWVAWRRRQIAGRLLDLALAAEHAYCRAGE